MRAISLWQHYASAIAFKLKRNETRSWRTDYRGPLAIHAAKTREHVFGGANHFVAWGFKLHGVRSPDDLPFGCVVCTCRIVDCVRTEDILPTVSPLEFALGDYGDGRFAWILEDIVPLPKPVPAKGAQGFWRWEP